MCRTKISPSRRSMHGVMANTGWGPLVIKREGLAVSVPQSRINKQSGRVYKRTQTLINQGYRDGFTRELAEELDAVGIDIFVELEGCSSYA